MSAALTAAERGDLAEEMLPVAARLSTIVHGDGGREDVERVLGQLSPAETTALIVVLAGLTDPDRPMRESLGWLTFDEDGRTAEAPVTDHTTLRDLVEEDDTDEEPVDEVAVARFLMGWQIKLSKQDRIAAIITGLGRGLEWGDLDRMSGLSHGSTNRFFLREQKAAALRGQPLAYESRASKKLSDEDVVAIRERAAAGERVGVLALEYGLVVASIRHIIRGTRYQDVGGPITAPPEGPAKATQVMWLGRQTYLSPDVREQIRERAAAGASVHDLAREFQTNTTAVLECAAS